MKSFFWYFGTAIACVLLQSSLLPELLPPSWQPSLIMIVVVIAGLRESFTGAIVAGLFLGALQDSFSGTSLGLYVTVYLVIALLARIFSEQLNAESPPLLLLLIGIGTLIENVLIGLLMTVFADMEPVFSILLPALPEQVIVNLAFCLLLLIGYLLLQGIFGRRAGLGALVSQGRSHGH